MKKIFFMTLTLFWVASSFAGESSNFGNKDGSAWAQTSLGEFECINDKSTDNLQVLKLGGKIIYQQVLGAKEPGYGPTLMSGVSSEDGCFEIVYNQKNYVVIARSIQPPRYQVEDYALLNFNVNPPTITELGTRTTDKLVEHSLEEEGDSVILTYKGYFPNTCCLVKSPKPQKHQSRINLKTGEIKVIK